MPGQRKLKVRVQEFLVHGGLYKLYTRAKNTSHALQAHNDLRCRYFKRIRKNRQFPRNLSTTPSLQRPNAHLPRAPSGGAGFRARG